MQLKKTRRILELAFAVGLAVGSGRAKAEAIVGTVELNGASVTYDVLTGSGTLSNTSGTLSVVTLTGDADAVFDGTITGNVRLVKAGSGVQTFSRKNDGYTGGTLVEGGVLAAPSIDYIGTKGSMASGGHRERMITLQNGAVLRATTTSGTAANPFYMSQGICVPPGATGVLETAGWIIKDGSIAMTNGATFVVRGYVRLSSHRLNDNSKNGRLVLETGVLAPSEGAGIGGSATGFVLEIGEGAELLMPADGSALPALVLKGGKVTSRRSNNGNSAGVLETLRDASASVDFSILNSVDVLASEVPSEITGKIIGFKRTAGSPVDLAVDSGAELRLNGCLTTTTASSERSLVKSGAGRLCLNGEIAMGEVRVAAGSVAYTRNTLFDSGASLRPASGTKVILEDGADVESPFDVSGGLVASADIWIDATKIAAEDGAAVTTILNLGTAGGTFSVARASGSSSPTLAANAIGGRPALCFDGTHAFYTDVYTNKANSLTTFVVAQASAHVKWSSPISLSTVGSGSNGEEQHEGTFFYSFNRDSLGSFKAARGKVGNSTENWAFDYSLPDLTTGMPYLLEHRRDGSRATGSAYCGEEHADCVKTNTANWLQQNITRMQIGGRMYKTGRPYNGRLHNGYVGEVIIFTRALSDAEYASVENYLKRKWFGADKPEPSYQGDVPYYGSRIDLEVAEGATARFSADTISGDIGGDFRKTGAGTLLVGNATLAARFAAEEGTLALAATGTPCQAAIWLDPSDADTVTMTGDYVTSLANKGTLGGAFAKHFGNGPKLSRDAAGINGNAVLNFAGGSSLMYDGFVRDDGSPRSLHVYAVVSRTEYKQYTAPFSFAHSDNTDYDKRANGTFLYTDNYKDRYIYRTFYGYDARGLTNAVTRQTQATDSYFIDLPRRDADGDVCLAVNRMGPDWQLFSTELADDDVSAVPWYATWDCSLKPLHVNRVQLGGSMKNGGTTFGEGGGWKGRIGEFIVFDRALTQTDEAELLAYLRKKWLNKGEGSRSTPACLGGAVLSSTLGPEVALDVRAPARLVHAMPVQNVFSLALDGATIERVGWGNDPSAFRLFNVFGGVTASGNIVLRADPMPTETVEVFGYGTFDNGATWTFADGDGRFAFRDRPLEGMFLLDKCSGFSIFVR